MKKTFHYIISISAIILFPSILSGQTISSPYSSFGAGQITNTSFGANPGLGGTGIAYLSGDGINTLNPASYSGIDSLSFLLDIGFYSKYTKYSTSSQYQNKFDANISHFSIGFRINRFLSSSLGMMPYSTVGYTIYSSDVIDGTTTTYTRAFTGEGGINKFYFGNSLRINKNIALGVNLAYIMGTITQSETGIDNAITPGYTLVSKQYLHNLMLDYGLLLSGRIKESTIRLGATYNPGKTLNITKDLFYSSDIDTTEINAYASTYSLPQGFGLGLSVEHDRIRIGVDYQRKDWAKIKFDNAALKTRNSEQFGIGIQLSPPKTKSPYAINNFDYRLGAIYCKSYLVIHDKPLDQKAITLGFGIPVSKKLSKINFSLELGQYGSHSKGLIRENYMLMHVNFNLKDIWFQKVRYY